ncbi:hypothetical protein IT087_00860 [Candidatus Uhrbacteria bacterium]|nr:hypothetical protein [Candidatus Uhrbacteria bacterium]
MTSHKNFDRTKEGLLHVSGLIIGLVVAHATCDASSEGWAEFPDKLTRIFGGGMALYLGWMRGYRAVWPTWANLILAVLVCALPPAAALLYLFPSFYAHGDFERYLQSGGLLLNAAYVILGLWCWMRIYTPEWFRR